MDKGYVTVFGGSGFVGTYIVKELATQGFMVQVVSRHPNAALKTKVAGLVGQVTCTQGNIRNKESVERCVKGSDAVINLVGLLYESGKQKFSEVHTEGSRRIAEACKKHDVKRLIHMSALGVDQSHAKYAKTKLAAEDKVKTAFPDATILRPSIVVGAEDNFFNMFADMAKLTPALPLIGGGKTLFQPVYVEDVAKAFVAALMDSSTKGKVYEIGGPETYSFKELLALMLRIMRIKRALLPVPYALITPPAYVMNLLPKPPLTPDQLRSLKHDNVVQKGAKTLKTLGITPLPIEPIVAQYLAPRD